MNEKLKKPERRRRRRATLKHSSSSGKDRRMRYIHLRMEFLRGVRWCQVGRCMRVSIDAATGKQQVFLERATQVHHKRGRGRWLLDVHTFLGVCPACHQYIHEHPEWAMKQGYMESRRRR